MHYSLFNAVSHYVPISYYTIIQAFIMSRFTTLILYLALLAVGIVSAWPSRTGPPSGTFMELNGLLERREQDPAPVAPAPVAPPPLPLENGGNCKGSSMCRSIDNRTCRQAFSQYGDNTTYTKYTSWTNTQTTGMAQRIYVPGCTAIFSTCRGNLAHLRFTTLRSCVANRAASALQHAMTIIMARV